MTTALRMDLSRLYAILDRDPQARRMLHDTEKVIKDCEMAPQQADTAYEMCILSAVLKNPEAFRCVADEVWKLTIGGYCIEEHRIVSPKTAKRNRVVGQSETRGCSSEK